MSAYTDRPEDWYRREGGSYITARPLPWDVGRKGSGLTVTVPAGFPFDFSAPRWPRWLGWLLRIIPKRWQIDRHDPRYLAASALHDWCLVDGWDRWTAGAVFRAALEADGVSTLRRVVMTLATIVWPWLRRWLKHDRS